MVLIPSDDPSLLAVSKHKERLKQKYIVIAPDHDLTVKCIEKKHIYEIASEAGVPAPKTIVARGADRIGPIAKDIGYPVLLKPSIGHLFYDAFRIKMFKVDNPPDLDRALELLGDYRHEIMVQEYIPGGDACGINYNSFRANGEPVYEFTAQKLRLSPPNTGFPRVIVSKEIPQAKEPGRAILRSLGYEGFSCVEFKKDERDGVYKLMEVNPRLNLSSQHAVRCGYNFPLLVYHHSISGEILPWAHRFKEGVFWIDPGKDIAESIRSYRMEGYPLRSYIGPYLGDHVFTIPSVTDPFPLVKRMKDFMRAGLGLFFNGGNR
jgi:predicted ATP-grasp superfamily ATP-dependent carboligase